MDTIFYGLDVLMFLLGLCIGSFLNCFIYRLEKEESVAKGRSYCPHCKHSLAWFDLIPVLSFLMLQGKCRYCRGKISIQYPIVEIVTGLIFVLISNQHLIFNVQNVANLLFLCYIASSLIIIFVYDLKHYLIPDSVLFPAIIIAFLYRIVVTLSFSHWNLIGNFILAALIASGFFLVLFLISGGRAMGFGDVKLGILLGLVLGFPNILVALFLAFFLGAIIGVVLIATHKKGIKSEVPFGPFLITGTLMALLWGSTIIQWYMHFFIF